jgi:hypothetical protein
MNNSHEERHMLEKHADGDESEYEAMGLLERLETLRQRPHR